MVIFEKITESPLETQRIAQEFAKDVLKGDIVFLEGELGAGKTEFVRGFVSYHGIRSIRSPSFTVVFEHWSKFNYPIYHIDLYRFEGDFIELLERGIIDIFEKKDGIVLVEWADRLKGFYTPDYLVEMEHISPHQRKITVKKIEDKL